MIRTAEETRKIAKHSNSVSFDVIMREIESAALKCRNHVEIEFDLNDDQIKLLKELGYELPPVGSSEIVKHSIHW